MVILLHWRAETHWKRTRGNIKICEHTWCDGEEIYFEKSIWTMDVGHTQRKNPMQLPTFISKAINDTRVKTKSQERVWPPCEAMHGVQRPPVDLTGSSPNHHTSTTPAVRLYNSVIVKPFAMALTPFT